MALVLQSPAFANGASIPKKHTADGDDVAPALEWSGAPDATKSFALIVDDPDAPDPAHPKVTWVHWVAYDIPASVTSLPEGGALPSGAKDGTNDWKRAGWGGPSPPVGKHRYFFKLYALDCLIGVSLITKGALEKAMQGHVLARAEIVGHYGRR